MRFVKIAEGFHVNLDVIAEVGRQVDGSVSLITITGREVSFPEGAEGDANILMAAVEAYSDTAFYDAVQVYVLKEPVPPKSQV